MRTVADNVGKVVNPAGAENSVAGHSHKTVPQNRRSAFTLVELLVVIGIIALLVSVLLPALNKARQQANLIDCQSRLRQMGQALNIYAAENNGLIPLGDVKYDPTGSNGSSLPMSWETNMPRSTNEISWYWDFTLSQMIQANILGPDLLVHNLSPIFHDVDTIDVTYGRYVNHYTCNPRIFMEAYDYIALQGGTSDNPQYLTNRKLSNIKPSTAFLFWDAPQVFDWGPGNVAYEQATAIDCNAINVGSYLFVGTATGTSYNYNRAALPGDQVQNYVNPSLSIAQQKKWNIDISSDVGLNGQAISGEDYFATHLRFRHLNNTTLNALCVDGHVETRPVGTFMVSDVCINPPG